MTSSRLKQKLRELALRYAQKRGLSIQENHATAIVFSRLCDNFHPESYQVISKSEFYSNRTTKPHPGVAGVCEMQSSNSSDALLMSIFCHPNINRWKGIRDLLQVSEMRPYFGFGPGVAKCSGPDDTEIDMAIEDTLIEAKLTEGDFKQKRKAVVEQYSGFQESFHTDLLAQSDKSYDNYQIIRNLLAAIQHNKRHVLLCDERRFDLGRRYMETVSCLRDPKQRKKCRIVFWQEIKSVCGSSLSEYLFEKYGMI